MKFKSVSLAFVALCIWATAAAAPSEVMVYMSPDGKFQFEYSATLTVCIRNEARGALPWEPEDCVDYVEPCGNDMKAAVCLAFPKGELKHYPVVSAGTLSVATLPDRKTDGACLDLSEYLFEGLTTDQVRINDVEFRHVDRGFAGGGHGEGHSFFRNFHDGTCYQIDMVIATAMGGLDLKPEDMSAFYKEDEAIVRRRLKQVVDTFRFLK
jgi:hypothetical protein